MTHELLTTTALTPAEQVLPAWLAEWLDQDPDLDLFELPDGIYLDLPPWVYFGQVNRLGSSDLVNLDKHREGWWWQSRWNTLRKPDDTAARAYGTGLHVRLLEGEDAYQSQFIVKPDPADFSNVLETIQDMRQALEGIGWVAPTGISKWKAKDWAQEAEAYLPRESFTVWPAVEAAFAASVGNRTPISAVEDRQLAILVDMALNTDTPEGREVAQLLADPDHPRLVEVSVFWTDQQGVQRRARLDRMFPLFDLDLKSTRGHWGTKPLELVLDDAIRGFGYDTQRADYHTARRMIYAMLRMDPGLLRGGTDEQRAWLSRWPDLFPRWDWVWLFYQKPDMVEGKAPVVFPLMDFGPADGKASDYHRRGLRKGVRAVDFFLECLNRWGLNQPWGRVEPLHYTAEDYQPRIATYPDNSSDAQQPLDDEDRLLGIA